MSPTPKIVDARGLACPQPVILTRKALAEGGFEHAGVDPMARPETLSLADFVALSDQMAGV